MIRTALSISVLSGTLILFGGAITPTQAEDPPSGSRPIKTKPVRRIDDLFPITTDSVIDSSKRESGPNATDPNSSGVDEVPANANRVEATDEVPDSEPTASPEDTGGAPTAKPARSDDPLSPEMTKLRDKVRRCLMTYYHEPLSVSDHSPWGVMHALIAYGVDTEVYASGKRVNAIGWMCFNQPCRGVQLLYLENGKLRARIGPGYQGHAGQFLAMLAQSKVQADFPLRVEGRDFTVADLIESEKQTCRTKSELTFKLISLAHYLPTNAEWKNDLGEDWSISRLIKEELAQNVVGAACGGTHRMTGFSYAVNKRTKLNEPFDGQWLRAQKFVSDYHDYIFKLQNDDGSFSTNWFQGRGDWGEEKRRIETTGHMLEWLVCSLPKDELEDPRVVKTVNYLTDLMMDGAKNRRKYEIGPRGHALHGLAIYNERVFGDRPGSRDDVLARKPLNSSKPR